VVWATLRLPSSVGATYIYRTFTPLELPLSLSELLSTERVCVPLGSHSKAELLRELVRLAVGDADETTLRGILDAVEARESQVSTAVGGGLAVPHGRTDLVPEVRVAAGIVRDVPDYVALDGSPVRVAFLVLTPTAASGQHVKLLSRIARLMHQRESRDALLISASPDEFMRVIRGADAP
jgi:mannitol/fructose-specific phosphotransferase system IIA component (Ntr-type)